MKLKAYLENRFVRAAGEMAQRVFVMLLVIYLLLLLAETILEASASDVFNLNYILIAVIVLGIPAMLSASGKPEKRARTRIDWKDIVIILFAGNAGLVIVWYETRDIGWQSYLMAVVSCVLIVVLSLLIFRDGDEGKDKEDK